MDRGAAQPRVDPSEEVAERESRLAGLLAGAPVAVRNRFDGRWVTGYRVDQVEADGYRPSRSSGGDALPLVFAPSEVRAS